MPFVMDTCENSNCPYYVWELKECTKITGDCYLNENDMEDDS